MNVVFYNDSPVFGGHEIMTISLIRYCLAYDHKVTVMLYEGNEKFISYIARVFGDELNKSIDIKLIKYSTKSMPTLRLIFELWSIYKIWRDIKALNPSLVVVSQGSIEQSLKGYVASMFLDVPMISYIPYTDSLRETGGKFALIRDFFNKILYKSCKNFIVVHDIYKKVLENKYGVNSDNIYIVNNTLENIPSAQRDAYFQRVNDEFVFVLVGRMYIAQKGHDLAINAFKLLIDKYPNIKLRLVGSGPDEDNILSMLSKHGLKNSVELEPWVEDVSELYNSSDIILMPSYFEGVSLVLLESMSMNKPIIASDLPVFKAHLNSEWLFKAGDYLDLVRVIEEVVNSDMATSIEYRGSYIGTDSKNELEVKRFLDNCI